MSDYRGEIDKRVKTFYKSLPEKQKRLVHRINLKQAGELEGLLHEHGLSLLDERVVESLCNAPDPAKIQIASPPGILEQIRKKIRYSMEQIHKNPPEQYKVFHLDGDPCGKLKLHCSPLPHITLEVIKGPNVYLFYKNKFGGPILYAKGNGLAHFWLAKPFDDYFDKVETNYEQWVDAQKIQKIKRASNIFTVLKTVHERAEESIKNIKEEKEKKDADMNSTLAKLE